MIVRAVGDLREDVLRVSGVAPAVENRVTDLSPGDETDRGYQNAVKKLEAGKDMNG